MSRFPGQVRNPRRLWGFSIVEVLVGILLLAIVLGSSYPLIMRSMTMMRATRDRYIATTICLARIERARAMDYSLLPQMAEPSPGLVVDQDGKPVSGSQPITGPGSKPGNWRRTTQVTTNSPSAGLTLVVVRTDIRNRLTAAFEGPCETMSCLFTEYLTPP